MKSLRCALYAALVLILFTELLTAPAAVAQVPGPNVNMVSGTQWPTGDPFLQRQNEPSMAVSTRNPMHILAGANDYRTVDLELVLSGGAETGDSWLGLFKSFDGGLTWTSTLLPGCPESVPQCVDNGALGGRYQAASDPVVRAGTNGMFYYAGLAFDRATGPTTASSVSSVFVARFADLNNNENLDTITYIDTHVLVSGNSSQFLDKPALAVDIPRSGATTCSFTANEPGAGANGGTLAVPQSFPAGNVYLTYTDFLAPTKSNATPTHLMFTRSTDCGVTWSTPIQINTGTTTSQGSAIAVNPWNGNVYVAWRQFSSSGVPDAIMVAESTNAGKTFNAPVQISTFQPFDQGTTLTSFRTNAYPSITTDMFGFVYVAFSARGLTASGDARVVVAGSIDGTHWTPPIMVDNPPQNAQNPSGRGHQIMPVITFANGRLTLLYYDLRLDHYAGFYTPSSTSPTGYLETLNPEGELAPPTPMPSEVFTKYIDDAGLTLRRHTLDLRVLELGLFPTVTLGPSVLVSQYAYGCCVNPNLPDIEQYKFNVPNLPLFAQGQDAFFGDYIDVVPSPLFLPKGNSWIYNFTPSVNPLFHAVWTDNRDVVPPANGNWADYTPPVPVGTGSVFQPGSTVPTCQVGQEGMRNQNIYTSQITGGLVVGAPGNAKPLGTTTFNGQTVPFQRAFAVEAQNVTGQTLYVRLSIANQPTGGTASFLQFSLLTTLDVTIPPYSSISRSVFVTSTNPEASITVNVAQISGIGGTVVTNGLNASTVLNPDITNPNITNPNITNPNITNPNITNFEVTNPNITNPNITNPNITNPNITNPNITNPNITNPNITNPNITNVSATNPNITNTTITNPNITNPNITNPNITNPDITNGSIQDVNYGITNNGNTTSSYTVKLVSSSTPPNGIVLQLILNRLYQTPVAASCQLGVETHWVTAANIISPKLFSASDPNLGNPDITNSTPNEATVTLIPGETAYITLRVVNPTPALTPFNPVTAIAPVTVPQAVNTQTVLANPGNTSLTSPVTYPTLSILSPATLPATDQGDPGVYSYQLQSTGGAPGTLTWSIIEGALPSGMSLSSSGLITGQTTALGPNSVTIQVADSASPPNKTSKTFSIPVNPVFLKNVVGIINDGVVGQAYVAVPFTTTGGTAPITWTATGLPPGLSINGSTGQVSGTPTTANPVGYSVQVTATDSALPPSVLSATITIRVGAVIQITPATLPAGTIGVAYAAQLSATGGIGAYVFGPPSPATGVLLSSNGSLTIQNPQSSTLSFSVTVHDSANPSQSVSTNYTITFGILASGNITFTTQPANSVGGQVLSGGPIVVHVVDNTNAVIPGATVTMSLNGTPPCSTAVLSGTLSAMTNATGDATFSNLSVDHGQIGYTLRATVDSLFAVSSAFNVSGYCETGNMNVARHNHIVIALPSGKILITGGAVNPNSTGALASAELYDPVAHTFTTISPMNVARVDHTMTLLPDGTVLVVGGFNDKGYLSSAEIYNPSTQSFTLLFASMTSPRGEHTATLLPNGTVLIAGGNSAFTTSLASAEIYNPSAQTFTATSQPMTAIRQIHHADLLPNGKVLISGGLDVNNNALASAEVYDPAAGTFTATGSMNTARGNHDSALLYTGEVLVAGGLTGPGTNLTLTATAELYNPSTGTFTVTGSMSIPRSEYAGIVLPDGTVLVAAGAPLPGGANADLYNPATGLFTTTANFTAIQIGERDAVLNDGTVLLASGVNSDGAVVPNSEIFYPPTLPPGITITTTTLPTGIQDAPYTQLLLERGGVGTLAWTLASGALPPGITLSASGTLSGSPTAPGTFNFSVKVADSSTPQNTATSGTLTIVVTGVPLQFTSSTMPTAGVGRFYSQPLPIAGGTPPYIVAQTGGTLSPGLSLSSNGVLAGTPSAAGSFTFTVQATDSSATPQSKTQTLTIAINTLFITTTALPNGIVGVPYNAPISTSGGTLPLSFSLANTAFPPGLLIQQPAPGSQNGALAGTPTQEGTFTFTESVVDSSNPVQTATQYYIVSIAPLGTAAPANVTFVSEPQTSVGGQILNGSPIIVRVANTSNAPIAGASVALSLNGEFNGPVPCSNAILSGTLSAITDANGQATFSNLSIDRGGFNYVLLASAGSASAVSTPFHLQGFCASGNLSTQRELHTQDLLGTAQSIVKFPIDPKGAYIFTNTTPAPPGIPDIPDAPLIIPLASLGIKPGDVISGVSVGDANFCSPGSFCFGEIFNAELCGVFSASSTLLPSGGTINRIPGAIMPDFTTAFPCNTLPTNFGNRPTDIPQDFSFFGEPVMVPNGAAYLFVAVSDSFYTDNSDPNGDFGVAITINSPSANGKVLIAGGIDNLGNALNTAELYDPASGTTSPTGNLTDPNGRAYHASVVLPNGKVLLIGGLSNVGILASAELYDPASGTFTATGSMSEPRFFAVAALLADGRVLVTGGLNTNVATNRAEIYDPSTGLFTPTGNMNQARARHTMTLLPNGKVLVTGGRDAQVRFEGTASAEIFDPFANQGVGAFTLIGNMNSPRFVHTATLLPNGTVLIAGGFNDGNESLSVTSAETFDYRTNVFTPTGSMSIPRARQTSTLLPDGTVLEVGGINSVQGVSAPAPAEVYSPTTGSFALTGAMITGRELPRATLLFNGNAVVSGGDDGVNVLASTEVYYNPVVKEPIVITTTSVPNGFISQPYVQLLLEQNTSGPVTYSLASGTLPPGISLSPSGILSGTPTATGSFIFTVQVTDGISAAPASFTINVSLATLTFTSNTMPTAGFGRPYSQLLPVTGGTLPYMATLTAGSLPPGLTLSSAGVLSGTPASAGSFTFTVNVMDSSTPAQSATQTLTIAVNNLFITTTALPNGVVGVPYNAAISTDGGTLPLSFSLTTAAFPPGLTIQQPAANSHNGALSGTPTLAGHYSFSESVVDSSTPAQTATHYYTMDILAAGTAVPANLTFAVQPQNSIGGQILGGSPILVHVTDANNAPILGASVVISFNGAPPCSTAVLSGTLNAITGSNGNAVFPDLSIDQGQLGYTLLASAGSASAVSQPFTVNGFCPNGLNITTTSPLPNGSLGSAYSTMVTAAGGTPPYTWSLASGSTLPAGLALASGSPSATISGTPTATGTFQFSLDVKDSSGTPAMASASFLLTITGSTTLNCPATVNLTLCGTYFYGLRGFNSSGGPVAFGGTFVADNAGHIVSGQQRTNDSVAGVTTTTFTGGSYVMDSSADGRGVLTLTSSSASVSIFRFVLESAANAGPGTVEEFDGTGILASGILFGPATPPVPQLPANALMGIALEGIDSSGNRTGLLGELQVGASGCNGASGSLASPAGEPVVSNTAGTVNAALTLSGSCTAADTNTGVGTAQLTISGGSPFTSSTLNFTYIVVGSGSTVEGALFLETDAIGAHQPMLSGLGAGTVPPTGGFNGSSFSCPCLLVSAGTTNGSATSGGTDASIVRLTTSGTGASGTVAGVIDENSAGTITLAGAWPYSAFTVDAAGLGTLTGTGSPTVHFIATGSSGNDFTFSTLDESAGVQVGSFRAQNATSIGTPGSPYIAGRDLGNLGITQSTQHILGVLTPSGTAAGTFTGALDVISSAGAFAGVSPSGSYTGIDSTTGRGTGTANLTNGSSAINIVIYVRRVRQFVILDVGSTNPYVIGARLQ